MANTALSHRISRTPLVFDERAASEISDQFSDLSGPVRELLGATASCSGYLARSMQREETWLREIVDASPEETLANTLTSLHDVGGDRMASKLRIAKRRIALLVALADLCGAWSLHEVTGALTQLADRAVQFSLQTLVAAEIERGKIPNATPEDAIEGAGMFVVAMGKMGAGELNYSSDIDLIVLFDETRHDPNDYAAVRKSFIRVTQKMVTMLSKISGEGYVFRTDLRLRPDPSVTPVCIATEPAEHYYESLGRTWERSAFIKARVCAGAIDAGNAFLERLKPFVWRRHLDYAAIHDAHDMRKRIRTHKGLTGPIQIPGHDVKLGQGGIREIEFFTQTRQLILGGREPDLRDRRTLPTLNALAEHGWVGRETVEILRDAYVEHRNLEHRLQMVDDAQTQTMPTNVEGLDRIARFSGYGDTGAFQRDLLQRFEQVHGLTEDFFAPDQPNHSDAPSPEEVFKDPERAVDIMTDWQRLPALRTSRARSIFNRLQPEFMTRMAEVQDPDEALRSLDAFLSHLPAGVQLFSMMEANPPLLDLLVDICGTTPDLARYLGRNPAVLDAVLSQDFFQPLPGVRDLTLDLIETLDAHEDYETILNAARIWMKEHHFRIGVHLLRGIADSQEAGISYSAVAEAVLAAILPKVEDEFAKRHGAPPGAGATIVAMGKAGSREMTVSSDLDLIMIYDADGETESEGTRPLAVPTYYARLTQAVISALTAQMADGMLYKVDMRLRPSGKQGPLATSREAFRNYQKSDAWTWEHMALTRARVLAGPPELRQRVTEAIAEVIKRPHDPEKVLEDARDMRRRLSEAHWKDITDPWTCKRGSGRMMDIELLAQSGALIHNISGVRRPSAILDRLGKLGWLAREQSTFLRDCLERLGAMQQVARLASDRTIDPTTAGQGYVRLILTRTGAPDVDTLRSTLVDDARKCAEIIETRLAKP
ncbi:bifunctional [glutamine synthetase] adenylyltransferase/[glutamine synthetase]-adenylyl-L-tyrosine phosphorylase [Amaricoccus tamworthensis]|uniref:bifunctional [glutamine synthetase] adenylyltransferase/[glutamine synthetase]-adenylyl-L-tyrosine phosphorylase n=1 Tax=Amaricoccus tamworthensis TaxID=57002 RepID=UPI003C7D4DC0